MLREVQELFLGLVTAPEGVGKELDARGARVRAVVAETFVGDGRISAEERLDAYANMYFFRLRDVLAEDFARTAAALGETRWHNVVTDYLLAHPPTRWSLRWAGEKLPEFLRGRADAAERPWLADVAALEWARNEAFQAVDAEPMRVEELVNVHPEVWPTLSFGTVPGAVLVVSGWDLAGWWDGGGTEAPAEASGGQVLVVWRDAEDDARHETLDAADAEATRRLFAGAPFSEVCEAYAREGVDESGAEEAGRKAVELLLGLIGRGAMTLCPVQT